MWDPKGTLNVHPHPGTQRISVSTNTWDRSMQNNYINFFRTNTDISTLILVFFFPYHLLKSECKLKSCWKNSGFWVLLVLFSAKGRSFRKATRMRNAAWEEGQRSSDLASGLGTVASELSYIRLAFVIFLVRRSCLGSYCVLSRTG